VRRWIGPDEVFLIFGFSEQQMTVPLPLPAGRWKKMLDSADHRWLGPGSLVPEEIESKGRIELPVTPHALLLFGRDGEAEGR